MFNCLIQKATFCTIKSLSLELTVHKLDFHILCHLTIPTIQNKSKVLHTLFTVTLQHQDNLHFFVSQ